MKGPSSIQLIGSNALTILLTSNLALSGFKPQFFEQEQCGTQAPAGISFPLKDGQTVDEFEADHEVYEIFQKEFISQLEVLRTFTKTHLSGRMASDAIQGFNLLQDRLFNPGNVDYGGCKGVLYGNGKQMLDQIVALLDNGPRLDRCINTVAELGRQVRLCPTGAAENLTLALNRLRPDSEDILRLKEEMAMQLVLEFMPHAGFELNTGIMETHYGTAFTNVMAAKLGLKVQEDLHAAGCGITQDDIDACERYIEARLTPLAIARALAEEYLADFAGAMQGFLENTPNTLESFDYEDALLYEQVGTAVSLQKLKCGDVDADCFITQTDKEDGRFWRLNTDPTLLLVKILGSDVFASYVAEPFRPETKFPLSDRLDAIDPDQTRIMQYKDLIWATEDGQDRLLQARHLQGVAPHDLGNIAAPALAAAIKNSSPSNLLRYMSAAAPKQTNETGPRTKAATSWLSDTDVRSLLSEKDGQALAEFLKENGNMQVLDRVPDIAESMIADGNPSNLDFSKLAPATLLTILKSAEDAAQRYFSAAMQRNDAPLIRAMGAALLSVEKEQALPLLNQLFPAAGSELSPSLYHALTNNMHVDTIVAFGDIAIQAADKEYLSSGQLIGVLAARNNRGMSGWTHCMQAGLPEPFLALHKLLRFAKGYNHLSPAAFFKLLSDPSYAKGVLNLQVGLEHDRSEAVAGLGNLACMAYNDNMLATPDIEKFLACDDGNGEGLFGALAKTSGTTQLAFADVLLKFEKTGRDRRGSAFSLLSLPRSEPKESLPAISPLNLRQARSMDGLANLKKAIARLHDDFSAKKKTAREVIQVLPQLKEKILTSRLGLYLASSDIREKKEEMFFDIMKRWDSLDELAHSQLNRRRYFSEPSSANGAHAPTH
ncbi:MAG TPA: hypothetical protein VGN04_01195 [Herbaspirillum sp.]